MPSRCRRVYFALVVSSSLAHKIAFNLNDVAMGKCRKHSRNQKKGNTEGRYRVSLLVLVTVWSSVVPLFTVRQRS